MENVVQSRYNKTSTRKCFSLKKNDASHTSLYFNIAQIQRQSVQEHLALFLDEILSFLDYIDEKIKKATWGLILYVD